MSKEKVILEAVKLLNPFFTRPNATGELINFLESSMLGEVKVIESPPAPPLSDFEKSVNTPPKNYTRTLPSIKKGQQGICPNCKNSFISEHPSKKFCSKECVTKYYNSPAYKSKYKSNGYKISGKYKSYNDDEFNRALEHVKSRPKNQGLSEEKLRIMARNQVYRERYEEKRVLEAGNFPISNYKGSSIRTLINEVELMEILKKFSEQQKEFKIAQIVQYAIENHFPNSGKVLPPVHKISQNISGHFYRMTKNNILKEVGKTNGKRIYSLI